AAEHSTTTDQLEWLYVPELSNQAERALEKLKSALPKASQEANRLRLEDIPGMEHSNAQSTTKAEQLASDWSEIRPEWGLARNATFVIGKRTLTE
ncbi:Na-translocating system protein MpsB, partial [Staphylococcus aureus]|nr:Na-translocating system protein MpsB [Staphylococcus aureus]